MFSPRRGGRLGRKPHREERPDEGRAGPADLRGVRPGSAHLEGGEWNIELNRQAVWIGMPLPIQKLPHDGQCFAKCWENGYPSLQNFCVSSLPVKQMNCSKVAKRWLNVSNIGHVFAKWLPNNIERVQYKLKSKNIFDKFDQCANFVELDNPAKWILLLSNP